MKTESGALDAPFSFPSRFAKEGGTNPEELIAAAHAGCFSMALAAALGDKGHPPDRIRTSARVSIERVGEGFTITHIRLSAEGRVPGVDDKSFREIAEQAKRSCPVSRALAGVSIELEAKLGESGEPR